MKLKSQKRIEAALSMARDYGQIDGSHHRLWVIDQMVRALCGGAFDEETGFDESEEYHCFVASARDGEAGPDTYDWETGIAP